MISEMANCPRPCAGEQNASMTKVGGGENHEIVRRPLSVYPSPVAIARLKRRHPRNRFYLHPFYEGDYCVLLC